MKKKFPESKLAHKYLDGLKGLEIGGSIHNPFSLDTQNVDYTDEKTVFKEEEMDEQGMSLAVDIVAPGDEIPVAAESQDFVINSHVLEHFPDPINALKEWYRVVRPGGYIFMIVPHKERTFDRDQARTTVGELQERYATKIFPKPHSKSQHYSFWTTGDFLELVLSLKLDWKVVDFQDVDDKIGNGFAIVLKKEKAGREDIERLMMEARKLKQQADSHQGNKFRRVVQLAGNAWRELRRNGIGGIWQRIKLMDKWDEK